MKKIKQKNSKTNTNKIKKIRSKRNIITGCVYIKATFNNTIISISDGLGNVLSWATSGGSGYRGSRKSTPFAAGEASKRAALKVVNEWGLKSVDVQVKGPGPGREAAIRSLTNIGLKITSIADVTGIPHNGCRAEKERRV
jgi:small subunit ribosomal protein S11